MFRRTFGNFKSVIIDCFVYNTEVIDEIKSGEPIREIAVEEDTIYEKEDTVYEKKNKKLIFLYNYNINDDRQSQYYKTYARDKDYRDSKSRNIDFNKFK